MTQPIYPQYMGYSPVGTPTAPRMDGYEQPYSQFVNPQFINQNRPSQPQSQMFSAQNFVKCRAVTSIDEAKASMIDLDGSVHVFTDLANKKIYTKQINLDGTASLNVYVLEEDEPVKEPQFTSGDYVERDELEHVCNIFNNRIDDIQKYMKNIEKMLELQKADKPVSLKEQSKGGAKK